MDLFVASLVNGLGLAVLTAGVATVYATSRVILLEAAALYSIAPLAFVSIRGYGVPPLVATSTAIAGCVVVALLLELGNHRPLDRNGAGAASHFIASFAGYVIVTQVAVLAWGSESVYLHIGLSGQIHFGPAILSATQRDALIGSTGLLLVYFVFLRVSRTGLYFRAHGISPEQFQLDGFNANKTRLVAYCCAAIMIAGAGLIAAADVGASAYAGFTPLIYGVAATLLRGLGGTVGSATVLALIIGVMRTYAEWAIGASWAQAAVLISLVVMFTAIRKPGQHLLAT